MALQKNLKGLRGGGIKPESREERRRCYAELDRIFCQHAEPAVRRQMVEVIEPEAKRQLPEEFQIPFRLKLGFWVRNILTLGWYSRSVSKELREGVIATAVAQFCRDWYSHLHRYCQASRTADERFVFNPAVLDEAMLPPDREPEDDFEAEFGFTWPRSHLCRMLGMSMEQVRSLLQLIRQSLPEGQSCPEAALRALELTGYKVLRTP